MTPYLSDADFTLYQGDALDALRELSEGSVHCCVTSPPYWGLRDYGTGSWEGGDPDCDHKQETRHQAQGATSQRAGRTNAEEQRNENFRDACGKCGAVRVDQQLGLEATPEEYVTRMVEVFREVRRVLRPDGTCWLNLGDSYASDPNKGGSGGTHGLKAKDLCGIPWRVALALQSDGWYLRSDTIWAKPNPMPESVTDRPTKAHEYVFLLAKTARYFYDVDAIREPSAAQGGGGFSRQYAEAQPNHGSMRLDRPADNPLGRNARSVWEIATQPYADAHFAVFPEELPRRCIAASTSEKGCCPECGSPWEREVERTPMVIERSDRTHEKGRTRASGTMIAPPATTTTGWRPGCDHDREPVPCVVLDPFMGSGTTALVARRLGRHSVGIELNVEYAEMCARRLGQQSLLAEANP